MRDSLAVPTHQNHMMIRFALFRIDLLLLFVCCTGPHAAVSAETDWEGLMATLLSRGVAFPDQLEVQLQPPLADVRNGTLTSEQKAMFSGAVGWTRFVRDSAVAPIWIDLDYLRNDQGQRIGHRIRFGFVVHEDLATLRDPEKLRELLPNEASGEKEFESELVPAETLASLGVPEGDETSFGSVRLSLLNRVQLRGVVRVERNEGDDFVAIAWLLDPRFTKADMSSGSYRNQWVPLVRDELGKQRLGEAEPYLGAGGYLIVSDLTSVEDASLVQAEIVLHEPQEWFSGSNLLRSKVPLIIQESVRRFRRQLD